MSLNPRVEQARHALGPVGAFLPVSPPDPVPTDVQRDSVRRLEAAGYRSAWTNEVVGKDALVQVAVLLAATETMVFGTSIANVWARPAQTAHAAATQLADAYPGRFVLGLGVGYAPQAESVGQDFGRPIATMRAYLQAMTTDEPAYVRLLGANGPQMLALSGALTDGALPATGALELTEAARRAVGPDKLLVVYLDASGPDVGQTVRAHLTAGADHAIAGAPFGTTFETAAARLLEIAPELTQLADQ